MKCKEYFYENDGKLWCKRCYHPNNNAVDKDYCHANCDDGNFESKLMAMMKEE